MRPAAFGFARLKKAELGGRLCQQDVERRGLQERSIALLLECDPDRLSSMVEILVMLPDAGPRPTLAAVVRPELELSL